MSFLKTILALGAMSVGALAQTTTTTTAHPRSFPPVGLAPTETLQINLLNTAAASSSGAAASCTGSVSFTGPTGTAIGSAKTYTVASNQIVSVSLPFSSAGASGRTEIVASFTPTASSAPCALTTTLEVFDTSTGVIHLHLDGAGVASGPLGFGR